MSQFLDQLVEFSAILLEKFGVVFFQVVCATVGVIAALVFSGDIDLDAKLRFSMGLIYRLIIGVTFGILGGGTLIDVYGWQFSTRFDGFIMFIVGVFGVLVLGVVYQGIQVLHGKSITQIFSELADVINKIKGR